MDRRKFLTATGTAALMSAIGAMPATATRRGPRTRAATWPTHCLDAVPSGRAGYQEAFDYRQGGWAGADGAWPVALPDGRVLWLFGDSWMGEVDENDALVPPYHLVISAQVQDGACFTPLTGGTTADPAPLLPNEGGLIHWAAGGFVDPAANPPVLRIAATGVVPGTWGEPRANRIFTLSLPNFDLIGIDDVPYELAVGTPSFTGTLFHDGDWVYFYIAAGPINADDPLPGQVEVPGLYIARAPADGVTGDAYEYWTGSAWSADVTQAGPMESDEPADPTHWATPGSVVRWGDRYLMTGKMGYLWVFGPALYAWTSDRPTGPWSVVRGADGQPMDIGQQQAFPEDRLYYGGIMVTNAPGASVDNPILVYSTNSIGCNPDADPPDPCTPENDSRMNVYLYGPHFLTPMGLPTP